MRFGAVDKVEKSVECEKRCPISELFTSESVMVNAEENDENMNKLTVIRIGEFSNSHFQDGGQNSRWSAAQGRPEFFEFSRQK